jgi:site-specific recombinase XerD
VLPTFTKAQVTRLVNWKPKKIFWQRRLHLLILFLLDTGCRVDEALSVRVREIDFDNLLLTLDGKGRKQRIVTFSFELRRAQADSLTLKLLSACKRNTLETSCRRWASYPGVCFFCRRPNCGRHRNSRT